MTLKQLWCLIHLNGCAVPGKVNETTLADWTADRREEARVAGGAAPEFVGVQMQVEVQRPAGFGTHDLWFYPTPPSRTKWTRRVPHPVLIGHAASLTPY